MKKILFYIFAILLFVLLFQLIAKGYDESSFRQQFKPIYNNSPKPFSSIPGTKLDTRPDNRVHTQLREFRNENTIDTKYNSNCQFGVCIQGGENNP